MSRHHKYILDLSDLQFKRVKLHWKVKLLRASMWVAGSIILAYVYGLAFEGIFGSPRERLLQQQMENIKLQYTLIGRQLQNSRESLENLQLSDDKLYRPILDMDTVPSSFRKAGYGGVDRYEDLTGYANSNIMIYYKSRIDELLSMARVQQSSFNTVSQKATDWKKEMDHFPGISPVNVRFKLGDGYRWRTIHPVLGSGRMHNGQDFEVPYGTNVYATGDGTVVESGWNSGGFGNCIVIDHGYGLQTVYGHLSSIKVSSGQNVKRGDLIGLSGNSGLSSGPHLHYQVEQYGSHKNPVNFFNNDVSIDEYMEMIQAFESKSRSKSR